MNENLADVIRRYEQERSHRVGDGIHNSALASSPVPNGDEPMPGLRKAGCSGFAPQRVPRRAAVPGPDAMNFPLSPSLLFGGFDKDWTVALSRVNSIGLASPGCLACEMIGGAG